MKKKKVVSKKKEHKTTNVLPAQMVDRVVTGIDELYSLIQKKKKVSGSEAAKHCRVSKEKIEEWASALQDAGLVVVSYSLFGELILRDKS
ncbi:hypothetical protein HUU53_01030 [Candidatus Micrarchaeota archaeon]|nr:hypothetical protein [Candidatus Micrarchaeota archaeon]